MVAGGQPPAVVAAREVLATGGNAADAAVALGFSLAVSYPSRASLGSGGICLVFTNLADQAEALAFLPMRTGPQSGVAPLLPRALEAIHSRYGTQPWRALVGPAEGAARFGVKATRALTSDVAAAAELLAADPGMAAVFLPNGLPLRPGDSFVQPALAETLSGIREQGAVYLTSDRFAALFARDSKAAGVPVTPEELRRSVPIYVPPIRISYGDLAIWVTPAIAANGLVAAQLLTLLLDVLPYQDLDPEEKAHYFLEASAQAFAERSGWLSRGGVASPIEPLIDPDNLSARLADLGLRDHQPSSLRVPRPEPLIEPAGGTSFVIADSFGNAVACSLTMNGIFGSGRMGPESGIVMAAPPPDGVVASPVAAMVSNFAGTRLYMSASAAGGAAGVTAMVNTLVQMVTTDIDAAGAVSLQRLHHNAVPDLAFVEGLADERAELLLEILRARGHEIREVPALGTVMAWICREGLETDPADCSVAADPRGRGLAEFAP